jgi:hypothetical protein
LYSSLNRDFDGKMSSNSSFLIISPIIIILYYRILASLLKMESPVEFAQDIEKLLEGVKI